MRARITNISGVTLTLPYIYRGLPMENGQTYVVLGPASRVIANLGGERFMTGIYQVDDVNSTTSLDIEEAVDLPVTQNIAYYVSPSGDDANDGLTAGTAVKTISVAAAKIPMNIAANVIINLAPGEYSSYLYEVRNFIASAANSSSTLQFIGSFKDYTPATGPASGTFDASFGSPTTPNIASVTGATWTANDLRGKFLKILSGPRAGLEIPIVENTTDTLSITAIANTGTYDLRNVQFKIVEPAVTWANPDTVGSNYIFSLSGSSFDNSVMSGTVALPNAGYYFYGIKFTSRLRLFNTSNVIRVNACFLENQGIGSGFGYGFNVNSSRISLVNTYLNNPTVSNFVLPIRTAPYALVDLNMTAIRGGQVGINSFDCNLSLINCLIENQTSSGVNMTRNYFAGSGLNIFRNIQTGFSLNGEGMWANIATCFFLNCTTGIRLSGVSSFGSTSAPTAITMDGGQIGIDMLADSTVFKSVNNLTIKNFTQWGVRLSGSNAASAPMYSGIALDTTKTTMTGNTLGDFTLDGTTPIALADVAIAPNKLILDARGRGTYVRGL